MAQSASTAFFTPDYYTDLKHWYKLMFTCNSATERKKQETTENNNKKKT